MDTLRPVIRLTPVNLVSACAAVLGLLRPATAWTGDGFVNLFNGRDLEGWLTPFLPLKHGIAIILRILRESGRTSQQTAVQGVYQQMMGGRLAQLLRLKVSETYECVPEVSANKYALNIRFTVNEGALRPRVNQADVVFELSFCNL